MRSHTRARWLLAAVVLCSISPSVLADGDDGDKRPQRPKKAPKKSIDECASFQQLDREDEDGVDFSIHSSCDVKLSCGIKWTLVCAPGSKKAKKTREAVAFELEYGASDGATASAGTCGFEGWEITDITWSCDPVR
jgi:hypothetical protein